MKTALKWIGWCVLGLIAIGALGSADKLGQTILIVCGVVAYIAIDYAKHLRARHEELVEAIARLQRNLEAVHREV
ncbi:MAG TPA: hypothetical protein VLJ58_09020, partial [Ramlibacter sp.]|nr:hypothetical protein [Ramlibacter sp.]